MGLSFPSRLRRAVEKPRASCTNGVTPSSDDEQEVDLVFANRFRRLGGGLIAIPIANQAGEGLWAT